MRDRRRRLAYGTFDRQQLPAGPVREHLAFLARSGMGTAAVANASGVARSTIAGIRWGRQSSDGTYMPAKRVTRPTAAKLLAVEPALDVVADHARVDARGTVRRLQALQALGWSTPQLGAHLGVAETNVSRVMREDRVYASTARGVAALYERLWAVRPPADTATQRAMIARITARAAARGWVPPLGWDDIDADDAPAVVDELEIVDDLAVDLAVAGARVQLTRAERLIALPRLHARGYLDGELADLLCVTDRTIARDRSELGLPANYFAEEAAA